MTTLAQLRRAVIQGESSAAVLLAERAVADGVSPAELFSLALAPAMEEVGVLMQRNEYYIPEVLMSAKAMRAVSELLKPLIVKSGESKSSGKVVIGTVQGDLHDIGKNLVVLMLEGAGFQVIDLGADVSAKRFVEAVREFQPQILGLSALLTTTMLQMPKVLDALKKDGIRSQLKVMVGGAPLNQRFADEIGADGFGLDASFAVALAKKWVAEG